MVRDSDVRMILTSGCKPEKVRSDFGVDVGLVSRDALSGRHIPNRQTRPYVQGSDVVYVTYTSGSTGSPKGVRVTHEALVNVIDAVRRRVNISEEDTMLAVSNYSFDIAALEILLPLSVGGSSVICGKESVQDGRVIAEMLDRFDVTVMQATPVTWELLLSSGWSGASNLKCICGGETLRRDLADRLLNKGVSLWNAYGPTETTIWSTLHQVTQGTGPVAIGTAVDNTKVLILNSDLNPVPIGAPGEICIGGVGLAKGYVNEEKMEQTSFQFAPASVADGMRLYRTGDTGRMAQDGTLFYLGRKDDQVKIRGFRVELGEIEAVLQGNPAVGQCVAKVVDDASGYKRIIAYVQPDLLYLRTVNNISPTETELRQYLEGRLPAYMLPSDFMYLDEFPVTSSGKVDRRALPDRLEMVNNVRSNALDRPISDVESLLRSIWVSVLKLTSVGVNDNFFELGGHSLLAVKLFAEIERIFSTTLPLATLFHAPTIRELAEVMEDNGWQPPWSSLVPIQPLGETPPLVCVHGAMGEVLFCHDLARLMAPEVTFYALQAKGLSGTSPPDATIEAMAVHYVEELATLQPHGPYFLAGRSFGAFVALEMAQQLLLRKEEIALIALFDAARPNRWRLLRQLASITFHLLGVFDKFLPRRWSMGTRNIFLLLKYVPKEYHGRITLFRSEARSCKGGDDLGWSELALNGVAVIDVPGDHDSIFEHPHVEVLADKLKQLILDETQE